MKKILSYKMFEAQHATEIYFDTYSAAVQFARGEAESQGYEIDGDDWFAEVNTGNGKPQHGKTTKSTIGLIKNGKVQKKALHIQVYGMKDKFELNWYIG